MKCPVCSCSLRRVKSRRVEFDVCTNCAGVWFDSGELQVFLRDLVNSDQVTAEQTRLFHPRKVEKINPSAVEIRTCPKCEIVLKTFNYAYDSNIFVDKCPECEGIWTDAGEAKRLARYIKTDPHILTVGQDICKRQQFLENLKEQAEMAQRMKISGRYSSLMPRIIIPIGDDLESERFPLTTISIIALCTTVFLFQLFGVGNVQNFVREYGFVPNHFFSIGLFTSMFLHGGIFHLVGNMLFLWIFGDNVEDRFGRIGFVVLYLASDIAASVLYAAFHAGSNIPCIGASGAISGIMGAYAVLYPRAKLNMLVVCHIVPVPAGVYLTIWFVLQLAYSSISLSYGDADVAWLAHVGGFVFGMGAAWLVKKYSLFRKEATADPNFNKR